MVTFWAVDLGVAGLSAVAVSRESADAEWVAIRGTAPWLVGAGSSLPVATVVDVASPVLVVVHAGMPGVIWLVAGWDDARVFELRWETRGLMTGLPVAFSEA